MNDGLRREGREVDGGGASMGRRPPVECNEGKNEWFAGGNSRNGARVSSLLTGTVLVARYILRSGRGARFS